MTETVREAEAMTEAFMKSEIERMAREFYRIAPASTALRDASAG
jgi:hypothetical protein